jgi:hypothetical protein
MVSKSVCARLLPLVFQLHSKRFVRLLDRGTFVAANGDLLYLTFEGTSTFVPPFSVNFTSFATFSGGTEGRGRNGAGGGDGYPRHQNDGRHRELGRKDILRWIESILRVRSR